MAPKMTKTEKFKNYLIYSNNSLNKFKMINFYFLKSQNRTEYLHGNNMINKKNKI